MAHRFLSMPECVQSTLRRILSQLSPARKAQNLLGHQPLVRVSLDVVQYNHVVFDPFRYLSGSPERTRWNARSGTHPERTFPNAPFERSFR